MALMADSMREISETLSIAEDTIDGRCVVRVIGRIDSSNASALTESLIALITERTADMMLDLDRLTYLTSAGFRAMLILSDEAEKLGGSLALCNVSNDVRELFEMGGMLEVFVIHDSPGGAVSSQA